MSDPLDLDKPVRELDNQIEAVRSEMFALSVRLAQLLSQRDALIRVNALIGVGNHKIETVSVSHQNLRAPTNGSGDRPPPGGRAAEIMLRHLNEINGAGASAQNLNKLVTSAGLTIDAANKARLRLKEQGRLRFDDKTKMYHAVGS